MLIALYAQSFFASSKGRPEESIRRVKDSILTVLAMNDEVRSPLVLVLFVCCR